MDINSVGVMEARAKFEITNDRVIPNTLYRCDDCDYSDRSDRSIVTCPECDGEVRPAPLSQQ